MGVAGDPQEPFKVILADVPWYYPPRKNPHTKFGRGASRYPLMKTEKLCELGPLIQRVTAKDAALFMWVTGPRDNDQDVHRVIRAWGFRPSTWGLVWIKLSKAGKPLKLPGNRMASNAELAFLCWRGKPLAGTEHLVEQVILTRGRAAHSHKPDEQYSRIDRAFDYGPRLELFATQHVNKWTGIGQALTGRDIREDLALLAADIEKER